MAKATGTDIEAQLRDARSRMLRGSVDGEFYETVRRLGELQHSLGRLGASADPELYRHFPVAAVAVLETHFKASVAKIIDAGSPYLERGLALARERLRSPIDVLPVLHRKAATVGELIAHSIPFNSVTSLESALGAILDSDLKPLIQGAVDPYNVRNERANSDPIVLDVTTLWRNLAETFQRRHILAHEAATKYAVSFENAKTALSCVQEFASALDAILWSTVWKELPLTQYEMNVDAWKRHRLTRGTLAKSLRRGLEIATERGQRVRFREMHSAWQHYARQWIQWEDEPFAMGSISPLLAALARDRALKARLEAIDAWIGLMRPEKDSS